MCGAEERSEMIGGPGKASPRVTEVTFQSRPERKKASDGDSWPKSFPGRKCSGQQIAYPGPLCREDTATGPH